MAVTAVLAHVFVACVVAAAVSIAFGLGHIICVLVDVAAKTP